MLNLHAILPRSRANGPGVRFAVWFQGCHLNCPGCFNPSARTFEPRVHMTVEAMVERIVAQGAEIQEAINDGMFRAFNEQREVTTDDIEAATRDARPLSRSRPDEIGRLRQWAQQNARAAS